MNSAIELRHLRHYIALAEELHFGRAALRCNISQPPFSVSIRQLEEAIGFALVERSTREVRLTAAGTTYYEEAMKVVSQFDRAQVVARRVNDGLKGSLDVGFFGSMLYRGLGGAAKVFGARHPEVALRLVELSTSDQIPALLRHRINYAFVHGANLPESVMSEELVREGFVLCVHATHPAARLERARLADYAQEPFVLFSRIFAPTYYDQVVSICVGAGFHPEIKHEARHWLTVLACVSQEMGITLVPRSLASYQLPTLAFIEIEPSPVESFVRGAWLASDDADPALRAWHRIVLEQVRTLEPISSPTSSATPTSAAPPAQPGSWP